MRTPPRLPLHTFRLGAPVAVFGLVGLVVAACVEQEAPSLTAEDVAYRKQNLLAAVPSPQIAVNADLSGKVTYLGADLSAKEIVPGEKFSVTHYWQVKEAPGDWRQFTHASGPNNQGFMNMDHTPVRGTYPVSDWKAGDIIKDEHDLPVPATFAHSALELYVGLWKGQDRLQVTRGPQDGQNRVRVASIPVKGKAPPPVATAVVRRAAHAPKIDGKLDDKAWKTATEVGPLVNTLNGKAVRLKTTVKMAWDDKNLYVAFINADDDVWGEMKSRDDKLWQQEAAEIMIDANGDGRGYVEFQVSPLGTILDTYLPAYRQYEDSLPSAKGKPMKKFGWNSGIRARTSVQGTLNKRSDKDASWIAEIAIPLADAFGLEAGAPNRPPELGDKWRLNLFRLDHNEGRGQEVQGWSPPLVGDFHKLDRFGVITFADANGQIKLAEELKKPAQTAAEKKQAAAAKRTEAVRRALGGMARPARPGAPKKLELGQPSGNL